MGSWRPLPGEELKACSAKKWTTWPTSGSRSYFYSASPGQHVTKGCGRHGLEVAECSLQGKQWAPGKQEWMDL